MLREGRGIGVDFRRPRVVGDFCEKEITLLKTFADQAVIAIQNARLFNETKEALERQTATAEILQVICELADRRQPVFDAIVVRVPAAVRRPLTRSLRFDGDMLDLAAHHKLAADGLEAYTARLSQARRPRHVAGCAILDRAVIDVADSG